MRLAACFLLVGVLLRYNSSFLIGQISGWHPAAIYYIEGGLWEFCLYLGLIGVIGAQKISVWRQLAIVALSIGMVESMLVPTCRLMVGKVLPAEKTMCHAAFGVPIGVPLLVVYCLLLCYLLSRKE